MTKLEVIKANKEMYTRIEKMIETKTGLEKAVAELYMLRWAKGNKWMGGISDNVANKVVETLMVMGYEFDDIMNEIDRQMEEVK